MVIDTVRGAGVTATGGRKANEDALLAEAPVYVVADGMGGHAAGADASRAVVDAFHPLVGAMDVSVEDVVGAVERARAGVAAVVAAHGATSGSTLTGAVHVRIDGASWWLVLNVGDSRVYSCRGGRLAQVTVDHSRVQELIDAGELTPEEAERHPERNVITRAIGDGIPGQDLRLVPIDGDRRLVIVSDGLTKALPHARIEALLAEPVAPAEAARLLVETAVAAGARDNVTVVVAEPGTVRTPPDASTRGIPLWRDPETSHAGAAAPATDVEDDATRIASRRTDKADEAPEEDVTRVAERHRGTEPERDATDDDSTRIAARRAASPRGPQADDDATQIASRRSPFDDDATRVADRVRPAPAPVAPAIVAPAPGAIPAAPAASSAAEARERFDGSRAAGRPIRVAPPVVVATMPAPAAPVATHAVVAPAERARRHGRSRLRTRIVLTAAGIGVGLASVGAAGAGIWLLATL